MNPVCGDNLLSAVSQSKGTQSLRDGAASLKMSLIDQLV